MLNLYRRYIPINCPIIQGLANSGVLLFPQGRECQLDRGNVVLLLKMSGQ
jgi:hypothetical protein